MAEPTPSVWVEDNETRGGGVALEPTPGSEADASCDRPAIPPSRFTSKKQKRSADAQKINGFWWVIALAVVVRVAWAVVVPVEPMSDSAAYDTLAKHLAAGNGYSLQKFTPESAAGLAPEDVTPSAYWAVGAPAVYAACFKVFGHTYWPVVAVNLLVNVLTIALVMKLAALWFCPKRAAVAGLCLAVWPGQFMFVTVLASELLFAFGMVAVLFVWTRESWAVWWRVPVVGVLLGLTCLVRPTALLFPILLVIIAVAQKRGFAKPALQAVVAAVVMVAVVLPWSMRNQRELGSFVLVSANSGANLWMGNHPGTDGGYAPLPEEAMTMSEIERDAYLKQEAKDYIKAEPVAFVQRTLIKAVKLHDRETINVLWNQRGLDQRFPDTDLVGPLKLASTVFWWAMCGGGLIGMIMLWVGGGGGVKGFFTMLFHPTVVFWGYFLAVHAVVVIQDRYHWPSVPFIAMLAALPLVAVMQKVRPSQGDAEPTDRKISNVTGAAA